MRNIVKFTISSIIGFIIGCVITYTVLDEYYSVGADSFYVLSVAEELKLLTELIITNDENLKCDISSRAEHSANTLRAFEINVSQLYAHLFGKPVLSEINREQALQNYEALNKSECS